MFGGDFTPPVKPDHRRKKSVIHDIDLVDQKPGKYGHMGREPNTDFHVRWLHYKQKNNAAYLAQKSEEAKRLTESKVKMRYDLHAEKRNFKRLVDDVVKTKMEQYDEAIERRRDKLREILDLEEREFYKEVVDSAQKGGELRLQEHKLRVQQIRENRERERQELVKQKRLQQLMLRNINLRPYMSQKYLMETKYAQLQQIRENEARREGKREIDRMWYNVMMNEYQAKTDREEQEALDRYNRESETINMLDMQVKGKELLKAEEQRIMEEDRLEMEKLTEQLRRDEIEALDNKRKKRDAYVQELEEQIEERNKFLAKCKEEEDALEHAFTYLSELEIEKEKSKKTNFGEELKREMSMYRENLKQLERNRQEEDLLLLKLLEEHRTAVEKQQDEARCKVEMAKRELRKQVFAGRAEQMALQRQKAEQELKMKQAENELLRMNWETNERLEAENERLKREAIKQYRDDLKKQIEYNEELRKREKEELERQIEEGKKEEERFQQIVNELLKQTTNESDFKHPFRRVLERPDCYCPPPSSALPN